MRHPWGTNEHAVAYVARMDGWIAECVRRAEDHERFAPASRMPEMHQRAATVFRKRLPEIEARRAVAVEHVTTLETT